MNTFKYIIFKSDTAEDPLHFRFPLDDFIEKPAPFSFPW